jgi:PPK2 family polyphosphate:nucleotide phosphotransferase
VKKIKLSQHKAWLNPLCKNKEQALTETALLQKKLYDLLYLMFAHNKYSLLIILQGIDTSGKDGSVRHIFRAANPQGIKVFSFKKPTAEELQHDFLWRCHKQTPESGYAVIFNRSYYEDVTTVMVHPQLLKQQNMPDIKIKHQDFFNLRYDRINDFEKLLSQKGTRVIKLFLHISKKEQKKRIEARLKDRKKNWKFSIEDVKERKHWNQYMMSFEKMLTATSTKNAPWTIIPADNKWYRNYIISKTLVTELEKLKMCFPKVKS